MKRAIVIVLDGCGAGEAPDAAAFGDTDHPATIKHVWERADGLNAPNLQNCGFFAACGIDAVPDGSINTRFGRLRELSQGKDSVTGHWEMMGIVTEKPFPTYANGFPTELIESFEHAIGRKILGNKAASGTQIIDELGPEHVKTGKPIVYTSADSVFQIASHEEVVPLDDLYRFCQIARDLCVSPNNVQRVIARPFVGDEQNGFNRTGNRKDFPLTPPRNLVDEIGDVYGVGVVPELFGGRGFLAAKRTQNNAEHIQTLLKAMESDARFIFANFEDFDMLYGHRNDPEGFAGALVTFDGYLGQVVAQLTRDDILILTADHGNDPTSTSTDHSREYVPVCVVGPRVEMESLGDVEGMASIGATVAKHLDILWDNGTTLI